MTAKKSKPAKTAAALRPKPPREIRLSDYRPPAFHVFASELEFDLAAAETKVTARHQVRRNAAGNRREKNLILDAEEITVRRAAINGETLENSRMQSDGGKLILRDVPDEFQLTIENTIRPEKNTALSGLYHSAGVLCTQCEAQGFRRITAAVDRPDNLGVYSVTLRADKKTMPVLLSNGNLIDSGDCGDGRHFAKWHDPFPKPSYLFAIVAGDLENITGSFTTMNGREVALRIYAANRDIKKCAAAMNALKRAFAWDEKVYGREYDLDIFNVVAVDDFNMGAMENKSLNIFNTQYVLADPKLATDADFENVEAVVAHEYFHNWSGNRVTCRDWFQLSLKEGFTVFREQQFCADMLSGAVARIDDAFIIRNHQFREDAGPMAHPVRPASYVEINNFYTATVYNKGAEVIRMLHTLLGAKTFRRGADIYFARHDGQAVTTDDFVAAMETAAAADLTQFKNWYSQAGTPRVTARATHDKKRGALTLTLTQSCPPTPQQSRKKPFVIPLRAALFTQAGECIRTHDGGAEKLLTLSRAKQKFVFHNIASKPVVSLLRGFSAPVELQFDLSEHELALLLAHDDDAFNRWEAGQKLFMRHLLNAIKRGREVSPSAQLRAGIKATLATAAGDDPMLHARLIELPGQSYIAEQLRVIDPAAIWNARRALKRALGHEFQTQFAKIYAQCDAMQAGKITVQQISARSLRDACLDYLLALHPSGEQNAGHKIAEKLLQNAKCMTDTITALSALAHSNSAKRETALADFYNRYRNEPLLINKWLRIQACAPQPQTAARVETLTRHPAFDETNPNKVYALLAAFSHANPVCFHARDGRGYRLIGKWVARIDQLNPQVAARLASAFTAWKKHTPALKKQMRAELRRIKALPKLSRDVGEIVERSLDK